MANRTLNEIPLLCTLLVRPLLTGSLIAAALLFFFLPERLGLVTKLLISWDSGVALYLALTIHMMSTSDHVSIRRHAAAQDEGALTILGLSVFGAVASLGAIVHELVIAKNLTGDSEWHAIALAAATVFLSWAFMQTMFALHYAHEYYSLGPDSQIGGLDIPGKPPKPDYWDFVYFSFIIGTSAQTADVNITSSVIRRIALVHCVIVFFFNTTILALAINVGAGLI